MSIISAGGAVVGAGGAAGGYEISRSLRFNSADSAYLNRTPASASNRKTFTWSGWVKRSNSTTTNSLFAAYVDANNFFLIQFREDGDNGRFEVFNFSSTFDFRVETNALLRDPSAWYHIVVALDTTQATDSNRIKIYVNGTQQTLATTTYPTLNFDTDVNTTNAHSIGQDGGNGRYHNGYLTEINFIDGSALDPTSFGEFNTDTGVWQPKAYTGSYGTNGFYLNFSDNASTTTLGDDLSGNGNDWTTNNFSVTAGAGNDSLVDTPTNYGTDTGVGGTVRGNYATLNAVNKALYQPTISDGNLKVAPTTTQYQNAFSTISVTSGKWYCEVLVNGTPNSANMIGVSSTTEQNYLTANAGLIADTVNVPGYGYYIHNGNKAHNSVFSAYGNSIASGDVVGIALDLDNGKVWFSKNGTWQASGDPAAGTNAAFTGLNASLGFFISSTSYSGGATSFEFNFGQRPFAYTAPSGFKALCTQNLPEPTIVDGGEYFNTILYTGTGSSNARTGVGFQPDWVWIKERNAAADHGLYDAVRGVQNQLESNTTTAETAEATGLTAFGTDGFTVGALAQLNTSGDTYVAWNWKANGAGVSNTDGTITSTVSANTDSGFSIVTYTGTGSAATVGHGLGAVPRMIIVKNRDQADAWQVYHAANTANPETDYLVLNTTAATADAADRWNDTLPTSTVFSIGNGVEVNTNTEDYVAYVFAAIPGYSAFGSYTGNGSNDGPFVYTGFRPAFVMTKRTNSTSNWVIQDNKRQTYNPSDAWLRPNTSGAEGTTSPDLDLDFTSNGFKIRNNGTDNNISGSTYIYMAFAENPFKYSLAR